MPAAWAAGIAAVGGIVSASMSADAAGDARDAQASGNAAALKIQNEQFDKRMAFDQSSLESQMGMGYAQMGQAAEMYNTTRGDQQAQLAQSRIDQEEYKTQARIDQTEARDLSLVDQTQARDLSINDQTLARDQTLAAYDPTRLRGEAAGNQLQYAMGLGGTGTGEAGALSRNFTAADMQADPLFQQQQGNINSALARSANFQTAPGYEFRQGQGAQAVENSAASRGMTLSGAALKALTRFNQDFASNEYSNWFNQSAQDRSFVSDQGQNAFSRYNANQANDYNQLAGIVGTGQGALSGQAAARSNAANNMQSARSNWANGVQNARSNAANGMQGSGASVLNSMNASGQSFANQMQSAGNSMTNSTGNALSNMSSAYANNSKSFDNNSSDYANNAGNLAMSQANSDAAAIQAQARAMNQGLAGVSNAFQGYFAGQEKQNQQQIAAANASYDPIYSMGTAKNWWSSPTQ